MKPKALGCTGIDTTARCDPGSDGADRSSSNSSCSGIGSPGRLGDDVSLMAEVSQERRRTGHPNVGTTPSRA